MAKHCRKCGAKMAHFENPSRYICPMESSHGDLPENKARSKTAKEHPVRGQKRTWLQRKRMSDAAYKREEKKRRNGK